MAAKSNPLDLALSLARLGYKVFPCNASKKPLTEHGYKDGTNDPQAVRKLWAQYPGELVGIACQPSGVFAVDIDRKNGTDGLQSWLELVQACANGSGFVHEGPAQSTPSGGYHLIFKLPAGVTVPNNAGQLAPGIDLRSTGYICTGTGYKQWQEHKISNQPADPPAWLVERIRAMSEKKRAAPATVQPLPTVPADVAAYWYNRFLPDAREGNRNHTLYRMGLQLSWSGVPESEAEALAANFAHVTGIPEREALATMNSAYKAPKKDPANIPGLTRQHQAQEPEYDNWQPTDDQAPAEELPAAATGRTAGEAMPPALLTELGNSRRFSAIYAGHALHVKAWDWLIWDGHRWQFDETGRVIVLGKKIVDQLYNEAQDALNDAQAIIKQAQAAAEADKEAIKTSYEAAEKRARGLLKWALQSQTEQKIRAMIGLAESDLSARVDDFDANPWLLNCENGVLDLKTGQLMPHAPEQRITKIAGTVYDPAAKCPLWLASLNTWFAGNEELIAFIRRAIGMTLTGSTAEQVMFFLYGTGKNGKSVFSELLQALLGDYAKRTPTDTLMLKRLDEGVPNDIARLPGARAVIAAELAEGKRLNESLIKDLTGGDRITARFLRKEFFEFSPTFKLWMYGNHKPTIRGTDEGIWRRVRLVPFTVTIPEEQRDPTLTDKLKAELPGILAWSVQGCLEWQREGLGMPEAVKAATANYRAEQDVLAAFLEECCLIGPKYRVTAGALYDAYKAWAGENGENSMTKRKFSQALSERGYITDGREGGTGRMLYTGLGLITPIEEPHL